MAAVNDKNETSRFLGEGVSFKAKLIGILEVSEARGDRMCQEALSDLKMAIRAAGEHKQRITINIAIDGLRLRDEKTGDSLYHHPVHKISFIAQDMTDSRAFGYIFGSPDTGHRFFGIKTDKAASQVVIAMRDLFQVVFALKKKEIELAKQHLDKNRYGTSTIFSESIIVSNTKTLVQEPPNKTSANSDSKVETAEIKEIKTSEGPAVADLVDLELELNSLQQGITQMERITPSSDPFGSKDDPFGDSFTTYPPKPILPPPPSGRERSNRASSESSSVFSPKTPHMTTGETGNLFGTDLEFQFSHQEFGGSREEPSSGDWFTPSGNDRIFEEPPLVPEQPLSTAATEQNNRHEITKREILSQFDVFTELDPLGTSTGKIRPYVDKKDFFQELKNPPKKVLNDLVGEKQPRERKLFDAHFEQPPSTGDGVDPFDEDPFDKTDPFAETDFSRRDPFEAEFKVFNRDFSERFKFPPPAAATDDSGGRSSRSPRDGAECAPEPPPRPTPNLVHAKPPPLPPKKQPGEPGSKPPPPRPPYSTDEAHYDYMDNYETGPNCLRIEKSPPIPVPMRKAKFDGPVIITAPERPRKQQIGPQQEWLSDEDYLTPLSLTKQSNVSGRHATAAILLPPPQRSTKRQNSPQEYVTVVASFLDDATAAAKPNSNATEDEEAAASSEGLDITLSQLTSSNLSNLAAKLNIPANRLSNMTLAQLTEYVSSHAKSKTTNESISNSEVPFADFANFNNFNGEQEEPRDKYAVFRELLKEEVKQTRIETEPAEEETKPPPPPTHTKNNHNDKTDRYAALREIVQNEIKQTTKTTITEEEGSVDENDVNEAEIEDDNEDNTKIRNRTNADDTERKLLSDNENVIEYSNGTLPEEVKRGDSPLDNKIKSPTLSNNVSGTGGNNRPTSGSLSDIASGSSPEVDTHNNRSASEAQKELEEEEGGVVEDTAGESWAIFDRPPKSNHHQQHRHQAREEEVGGGGGGVSPWSSDSKEFGNGSPPEWGPRRRQQREQQLQQRSEIGSSGGGGRTSRHQLRRGGEQDDWWDTAAEPENVHYYATSRRSADSYEDEGYDYYERPMRRRRQLGWTVASHESQAGGHSSSSRDASPWEEEQQQVTKRRDKEPWSSRHCRPPPPPPPPPDRRDRRHADSWDEEDDYEYDEEHSGRYHWSPEQYGVREPPADKFGSWERKTDHWADDWGETRRHRRRREAERNWCCPDWEQNTAATAATTNTVGDQPPSSIITNNNRYGGGLTGRWYKHDQRYYCAQESPWEDDYANDDTDELRARYVNSKRTWTSWKRPSSASEMDRKTGETKTRQGQYHTAGAGAGGSDGERDRRYKTGRRSRSRDSQFPVESTTVLAPYARHKSKKQPECEFRHDPPLKKSHNILKSDPIGTNNTHNKRSGATTTAAVTVTLATRKKTRDNSETQAEPVVQHNHTFPRRTATTFESETESPVSAAGISPRFTFENNDFETSEAESPIASRPAIKGLRFETDPTNRTKSSKRDRKVSPSSSSSNRVAQKSPFEDDFSPPPLPEMKQKNNVSTSSIIKEEAAADDDDNDEGGDTFARNNFDRVSSTRKRTSSTKKHFNIDIVGSGDLKKSESVNIFARESDPFDDEFFSGRGTTGNDGRSKFAEQKWTEDFDEYDFDGRQ